MRYELYAGKKEEVTFVGTTITEDSMKAMFAAQAAAWDMYQKAGGFDASILPAEATDPQIETAEFFDFESKFDYYTVGKE